jgi:hypothetical protein
MALDWITKTQVSQGQTDHFGRLARFSQKLKIIT